MNTGSTERTLTTKSVSQMSLRQICQWTAATSLVAAGSVALFSANTLEKLSQNGEISIDLSAFRKLGSASLALDQVDEQTLLTEDERILQSALFAQAEKLPSVRTKFRRIQRFIAKKAPVQVQQVVVVDPIEQSQREGVEAGLSESDAKEFTQLERALDPADEAIALADVYSRVRFRFLAAVERDVNAPVYAKNSAENAIEAPATMPETADYSKDSVEVAKKTEALEYDVIPELDASPEISAAPVETVAEDVSLKDSVSISASSSVREPTAKPEVMNAVRAGNEVDPAPEAPIQLMPEKQVSVSDAKVISTPGLDLVPGAIEEIAVNTQKTGVSSQNNEVKAATGPPKTQNSPPIAENKVNPSVGSEIFDAAPEISAKKSEVTPVQETASAKDLREYSADVAEIYDLHDLKAAGDAAEYSDEYSEDAEFTARPQKQAKSDSSIIVRKNENLGAVIVRSGAREQTLKTNQSSSSPSMKATTPRQVAGVSHDDRGTTIRWDEKEDAQDGKITISKPGTSFSSVVASMNSSSSLPTAKQEALIQPDLRKCETSRIGVEAFNPSAEKDSLSVCRRVLSQEGLREGKQARWWEFYASENEHWPTLTFLRGAQVSETSRVPMLSNASIRILSAISKTNTHKGTGIIFGEIPKGLEIQLVGRSDAPVYLDGGVKQREANLDPVGSRQFVFLNVQPGQPLLYIKDAARGAAGSIPLVVKEGVATFVNVPEPKVVDLTFNVQDSSSTKAKSLANLTAQIIGQSNKMGITDHRGVVRFSNVSVLGDYPLYIDVLQNEKSFKNRYRIRPEDKDLKTGMIPLYFFTEARVGVWLKQLSGGVSPFSGLVVGVIPKEALTYKRSKSSLTDRTLRFGMLEKKSTLVPERYMLSNTDQLEIKHSLGVEDRRFIGVQVPEGATIPTVIDETGALIWSEIVYSQPGVINVVGP